MGSKNNVSLSFSIIIACLIIIPIILLIGLTISGIELHITTFILPDFNVYIFYTTTIICIFFMSIALGLYTASFILYIIGTTFNKSKLINTGFGLGLPSWILIIFVQVFLAPEIVILLSNLNLISAVICIVFGSIVLVRRK